MKIRDATPEDLAAMCALGKRMHAESPRYSVLNYDEHKVELLLRNALDDDRYFLMVAEHDDGEVTGGFIGYIAPHWCSQDAVAADLALFVQQDRRGGIAAARLAREFIEWARSRGAKLVNLGISTGVQVEQSAALYRAIGLKQYGYLFEAGHE